MGRGVWRVIARQAGASAAELATLRTLRGRVGATRAPLWHPALATTLWHTHHTTQHPPPATPPLHAYLQALALAGDGHHHAVERVAELQLTHRLACRQGAASGGCGRAATFASLPPPPCPASLHPSRPTRSPTSGEAAATTTCTRRRSMKRVFSSLAALSSTRGLRPGVLRTNRTLLTSAAGCVAGRRRRVALERWHR